jgi:Arc/MetJ-type ribon-helix-helix transcriptional regulator
MADINANPDSPNKMILLAISKSLLPDIEICMTEDEYANRSEWLRVQLRNVLLKRRKAREVAALKMKRTRAKK